MTNIPECHDIIKVVGKDSVRKIKADPGTAVTKPGWVDFEKDLQKRSIPSHRVVTIKHEYYGD